MRSRMKRRSWQREHVAESQGRAGRGVATNWSWSWAVKTQEIGGRWRDRFVTAEPPVTAPRVHNWFNTKVSRPPHHTDLVQTSTVVSLHQHSTGSRLLAYLHLRCARCDSIVSLRLVQILGSHNLFVISNNLVSKLSIVLYCQSYRKTAGPTFSFVSRNVA